MEDFIFKVPSWQGEMVFSEEVVGFIAVIFLVFVGILFCFLGYKYFQTICLMGIAGVMCYLSYLLVERMTANRVLQMLLSVTLVFLCMCIVYFVSMILNFMLDKVHLKRKLMKKAFVFSSAAGGAVLGLTTYCGIYHNLLVAVVTGAASGLLGMLVQYKNRGKQVKFKTYHDILAMERKV